MSKGRKPAGPELVDGVSGSEFAKTRVKTILKTISGELTVAQACEDLHLSRTRFYDLRQSLIAGLVEIAEPRPAGRPSGPQPDAEIVELQRQLELREVELEAARIRADLNTMFPESGAKKNSPGWHRRGS